MPMAKQSKEPIADLQRTKRFMGTCPFCFDEFRLHTSIEGTIKSGNFEFRTLHVDKDGKVAER